MYFGELVKSLGAKVPGFDVAIEPNKSTAKTYINQAYKWIYGSHPWEWRQKTGQVTLIPNYETGTCGVTAFTGSNNAGARTVTFSGSTLTANMQGRYIKVDGEDYWHRIENVDVAGSVVYLDSEVTRSSGSGLTFKIWKRFYNLSGNVAQITDSPTPG